MIDNNDSSDMPSDRQTDAVLDAVFTKAVSQAELDFQVEYLRQHLPQVVAMEISAAEVSESTLSLCAPLAPNINDKLTAFGGSLASLATLTGWVMTAILAERYPQACDIVVTHTETDFKLPIKDLLIRTTAPIPSSQQRLDFGRRLAEKGRAKLPMRVEIETEKGVGLILTGQYLARVKSL